MPLVEIEDKTPAHIIDWLSLQRKDDKVEEVEELMTSYQYKILNGDFVKDDDVEKLSAAAVEKEFFKGGHRKMFSKKMRARVDGKTILQHYPLRQTTLFITINAKSKKGFGYNYSIVNYFDTPRGYVYFLRQAVPRPTLFIFTAHLFDRILQRQYKNNDHSARMVAVYRMLRYLDRRFDQDGSCLFMFNMTRQVYLAALGGLCLGSGYIYKALPSAFDFDVKNFRFSGGGGPINFTEPAERNVFMFMTYVTEKMLGPEQRYLYDKLVATG